MAFQFTGMFFCFIPLTLSRAQFFSSSFSNIKQNMKLPRENQRIWTLWRVQMSLPLLNQVCWQIVLLIQRLTNCVALSSTDSWMERMIRKKQDNLRKPNVTVRSPCRAEVASRASSRSFEWVSIAYPGVVRFDVRITSRVEKTREAQASTLSWLEDEGNW